MGKLKMPEEMTPEELERFERAMDKADEIIERQKKRRAWSDENPNDNLMRTLIGTEVPGGVTMKSVAYNVTETKL